jgi:hypothetical protein
MHDGSYAPAIIITDMTTGKQRKIKLAGHFTEREKARNEARQRAAMDRAYCRTFMPGLAY